ncbi:MAG: gliding motility-associated C-terminal domain-containing protein, partial [Saprospiraceae bacterium]
LEIEVPATRDPGMPIIADLDQDGDTEIFFHANTSYSVQRIAGRRVMPLARPIWNQHLWWNTNINDDLTVPRQQQSTHLATDPQFNSFMAMHAQYQYDLPDLDVQIRTADCPIEEGTRFEVEICNQGELDYPARGTINLRLQFHRGDGNWRDLTPLTMSTTDANPTPIPVGECIIYERDFTTAELVIIEDLLIRDAYLRLVVGANVYDAWNIEYKQKNLTMFGDLVWRDTDFYISECDFANNVDTLDFGFFPKLDLPPFLTVCANEPVLLNASDRFTTYNWNTGSQDSIVSIFAEGNYGVTVTDDCGREQETEVFVRYREETVLDLGDTLISCDIAPIQINMPPVFANAQWFPSDNLSCDNCTEVTITPTTDIEYIVIGETVDGCYSVDTLQIIKASSVETFLDTAICENSTLFYENENLVPNDTYEFIYESAIGCDSTVYLTVTENENSAFYETIELPTCANDSTFVENGYLAAGDSLLIENQTIAGCDSNLTYIATLLPIFETRESRVLCAGDSTLAFAEMVNATGAYMQTFTAINGCDSTHTIEVEVLDDIVINLQLNPACPDETDGEITANVTGGTPPYQYLWSTGTTGSDARISRLAAGDYRLTVTDATNCSVSISATLDYFINNEFSIQKIDISCFGETDGQIQVNSNQPIEISLDGENFSTINRFNQLTAGDYDLYVRDQNSCLIYESFTINEPEEWTVELPQIINLQLGDSIVLQPIFNIERELTYQWQPATGLSCTDCENPTANSLRNEKYRLQVIDNQGCIEEVEVQVLVVQDVPIYLPTAFSPNEDNQNDLWQPFAGTGVARLLSTQIFDRWGDQVYAWSGNENANPSTPIWDGYVRGQRAATGVYIYTIEVEYVDGRKEILRGDFVLLR